MLPMILDLIFFQKCPNSKLENCVGVNLRGIQAETFQKDLYPPTVSATPSMTAEEWLKGKNWQRHKSPFRPLFCFPPFNQQKGTIILSLKKQNYFLAISQRIKKRSVENLIYEKFFYFKFQFVPDISKDRPGWVTKISKYSSRRDMKFISQDIFHRRFKI